MSLFNLHFKFFWGKQLFICFWPLKFPLCDLSLTGFTGILSTPKMVAKESFLGGRVHDQFITSSDLVGIAADGNL